ncbi:MAG: hypothetical protein V3S00_03650 [Dehalococcoidia bacterium]
MTTLTTAVNASRGALSAQMTEMSAALRLFGPRGWLVAAAGTVAALILIGVPTAIIDSPFFVRMIPIRTQDYAIWVATAVLAGLIAGTFALPTPAGSEGKALSGGFLSYLAVGCPICNKFVVLLLGTSGALTFFAPAQLFIGLASLALLGWTFRLRARSIAGPCPVRR